MSPCTIELNDLRAPSLSAEWETVPHYEGTEWNFTDDEESPVAPGVHQTT